MDTKPIEQVTAALQEAAKKALVEADLSEDEWGIDLNSGAFVKKNG